MPSAGRACAAGVALAAMVIVGARAHGSAAQSAQNRAAEDARIAAAFLERVKAYAEMHDKLERTLPALPPTPTPEQLDTHQRALSRLIIQARGRAKAGDIFDSESRAYFRRQIVGVLSGPDSELLKSSIMDENPGRIRLQINGRYPDGVPVSTMPTQVLAALPKLPEHLEYHFIGERLILLDVHADLIVDFIDNALPR